jgi:hypothetical protein
MANGWTEERRKRQAERIRDWQPWERSTGPVTEEGKAKSAGNSRKHGLRSREFRRAMQDLQTRIAFCEEQLRKIDQTD